ncbi:MAG: hypothetical protein CFE24_14570 [Flavobacterium sp. BFFFF2]|nr:MAG: hypothetical protein CFE24_14570 [Flavobacterium sp. BFFFF2]
MRIFIIIKLTFLLFGVKVLAQHNVKEKQLTPFTIILNYGDESINSYKLRVFEKKKQLFAEIRNPENSPESKLNSIWTTKLDKRKIRECKNFIQVFKSLVKSDCELRTSALSDFTIYFPNDTLKLSTYCYWDNLDFFELRQSLFVEKFKEYERVKQEKINHINSLLKGKWYYNSPIKKLEEGDFLTLTKNNSSNYDSFWVFGNQNSFENSNNETINLKDSKDYQLDFDKDIYLNIEGGYITDKEGNIYVGNDGINFIIEKLSESELKLKVY